MILAEPTHEPKVRQGITTEVIGVDGNSYAPFASAATTSHAFVQLNAGLDGRPGHRLRLGHGRELPPPLRRQGQRQHRVPDRQLGAADRRDRLGRRAGRRPSDADTMRAMLREGMEEGAFGVSSGLDYPPGALRHDRRAGGAQPRGRAGAAASTTPTSATRSATASSIRSARRSRSGGAARRRPTSPTSTTAQTFPGTPDQMLDLVDDARAEGLDVTFDAYPSEWASTRLLILIPTWVQAGGPAKTKERLADRGHPRPDPPRARGARRALRRRGRPARRPDRLPPPAREPPAGRAGRSAS